MKRFFSGVAAVVLAMGMLTACGKSEQESSEVRSSAKETSKAAPESSDAAESSSQADEPDDSEAEEQDTEKTESEPQEDDTDKEKETVSLGYDVVYFSENEDPEGIGCSVKFSDEELNGRVETILELARAIQQNDKEAAKKIMNVDLGIEKDLIDEDEFTGSGLDDYFSDTKIGSFEFTADISRVNKTEVLQSANLFGFTISTFEVYLDYTDNEQVVLVAQQMKASDGIFTFIITAMTETQLNEERKKNDELSALKDANYNAKTAYNVVAEFAYDMETAGKPYTFTAEEFDTSEYKGELGSALYKTFSIDLKENGYVFVGSDGNGGYFTQWKESEDSDIIGQYPNMPIYADDPIEWGVYYDG